MASASYRLGAGTIRALPARAVLPVIERAGLVAARAGRNRRPALRDNLRRVVGNLDEVDLDRLVASSYRSYARYWAESARLSAASDVSAGRVDVVGVDAFAPVLSGSPAIIALPHIGTWEVGAVWMAQHGRPLVTVAEVLEPPSLFQWFVRTREALGLTIVPLGADASSALLSALRAGAAVALIADRDLSGDGVEVEFFGETTTLPGGPALLALRADVPIYPVAIYQLDEGKHRIVIRDPIVAEREGRLREDVASITQRLARELEELIRAAPEQWHVFQPNWPGDGQHLGGMTR